MPLLSSVPYRGYTIEYLHSEARSWQFSIRDAEGYRVHAFDDHAWHVDQGIATAKGWIDTEIAKAGERSAHG